MITNFSYLEEISPSQAETILGGFAAQWGDTKYDVQESNKADGDWTVTWVRTKASGSQDVYNYSAKYA